MDKRQRSTPETWAQLMLAARDARRVCDFLARECGIRPDRVVGAMHLTVYYARRLMPGVMAISESARVVVPAIETRFMVMAPGGENPRPSLDPSQRKVGIRVQRKSGAMAASLAYRARLLAHEKGSVLGRRAPSDHRRNAFGARHFQAHMSLIKRGSGIDRDLTNIGSAFRERIGELVFDRFVIDVVTEPRRDRPLNTRVKQTGAKFGNSLRWSDRSASRAGGR